LGFWSRGFPVLVRLLVSARAAFRFSRSFWFPACAAFLLWCGFWASAADTFQLASKYLQAQQAAGKAFQRQHNKALHPTAYSSVHFARKLASFSSLPAAGELSVSLPRAAFREPL
jgi:hypothetical protein